MVRLFLFAIAILLMPLQAFALSKPPVIHPYIVSEEPFGYAPFTWFIFDVYEISLWQDGRNFTYQRPFALSIKYSMGFSSDDLVDRTFEEIKNIHRVDQSFIDTYQDKSRQAFPDVEDG